VFPAAGGVSPCPFEDTRIAAEVETIR
jgi:hypothetical protein